MKTCNLTQSRARNDPINRRIHGYSFRDFEGEDGVQDVISRYPLHQFSIQTLLGRGNVSIMQRNPMTLELWCLDSSINLENPRVSFRSRRTL